MFLECRQAQKWPRFESDSLKHFSKKNKKNRYTQNGSIEKGWDKSRAGSLSNSLMGFVENCGSWIDSSSSSMVALSLSETNSNVHTMLISREDASFGTVDSSKVYGIMDKFTDCGLRSLAMARQQVPEKNNESVGDPREFVRVTSGLREE
ncbi:hypothetical protein SUGI_0614190 [Cryptomeria japonica]|nr:hypothetical protein SUGI_0614190 [Cryptomeria japonica]